MPKLDMSKMRNRTRAARTSLSERDERLQAAQDSARATQLRPDRIEARAHGDTRTLKAAHVIDLMESIAALGLIEPIVVDGRNRLLAGGHRLAACRLLAQSDTARLELATELVGELKPDQLERMQAIVIADGIDAQRIPVRVIEIDSAADQPMALAIEASENTLRRDYTGIEVRALYDRLREAGYVDRPGRPRRGERAVKPAIATIIGRSIRTVERMLSAPPPIEAVQHASLRQLARQIEKLHTNAGESPGPALQALLKRLDSPALRKALREALREAKADT